MNNEWHKYDMHLYRDSFQNYKVYQIPKAQLIIDDVTLFRKAETANEEL